MRPLGAAFRTPVEWQAAGANRGDGETWAAAVTLFGRVKQSSKVTRNREGQTVTRPMVVELDHTVAVSIGDTITAGGNTGVVSAVEPVAGAFGVPHHVEVTAA